MRSAVFMIVLFVLQTVRATLLDSEGLPMSTNADLRGILPAVITPFTSDGAVDAAALTRHTRYLIGSGVGGLIPGGSTGEFASLSNS